MRRVRGLSFTSRTLKVRGGIISQANRYLGGFCSSQRIIPPQIIKVLLLMDRAAGVAWLLPRADSVIDGLPVDLLYLSTSFLWWQAVAGTLVLCHSLIVG